MIVFPLHSAYCFQFIGAKVFFLYQFMHVFHCNKKILTLVCYIYYMITTILKMLSVQNGTDCFRAIVFFSEILAMCFTIINTCIPVYTHMYLYTYTQFLISTERVSKLVEKS